MLAALLFVAHLLVMGVGHHAPGHAAQPDAVASKVAAAVAPSHDHARVSVGEQRASSDGHLVEAGEPHEEPACGDTLRMRNGVDSGAALPVSVCVFTLPQLTEHDALVAVPASPRTPNLVRELQVQRV